MSLPEDPACYDAWRRTAFISVADAAKLLSVSPTSIYKLSASKQLHLKRLAGRAMVTTRSLANLIDTAPDWTPSDKGAAGRRAAHAKHRN